MANQWWLGVEGNIGEKKGSWAVFLPACGQNADRVARAKLLCEKIWSSILRECDILALAN